MNCEAVKRFLQRNVTVGVLLLCISATFASAQTFTTLLNFDGTNGSLPEQMSLVQGVDGNFYGTTFRRQSAPVFMGQLEIMFSISPSGDFTSVHNFAGYPGDGFYPYGGVVLATDGNFYGTTYSGGGCKYCGGIVYKMTTAGDLTILHTFAVQNRSGTNPEAGLVQSSNGDLYGTDSLGGENQCDGLGCGAVFKISPDKVFTPLH